MHYKKGNHKSLLGINPSGCAYQILYCTLLRFGRVTKATLYSRIGPHTPSLNDVAFSTEFGDISSKSNSPTNFKRSGQPLLLGVGLLLLGLWMVTGCQKGPAPTPKPRAYPKVVFPEDGAYQTFDKGYCDFTFEYPAFARIVQDTNFFGEHPLDPCWFDVHIPKLNSRIHCSYLPIRDAAHFAKLHNDAFTLAYKHTIRANSIEEIPIRNQYGVVGYTFLLEGPVASSYMFYLSDSTDHYLRGSLYFDTQARPDSLRPVFEFMKEEVDHMLQTFRWE